MTDIEAARAELLERGVEVSEVEELPVGRFVFFADPDGNGWALQRPAGARSTARTHNAKGRRRFAARISASDGTRTRDLRRDRPAL